MESEAASSVGFCCELKVVLKQYIKSIETEKEERKGGDSHLVFDCHHRLPPREHWSAQGSQHPSRVPCP